MFKSSRCTCLGFGWENERQGNTKNIILANNPQNCGCQGKILKLPKN